MKSLRLPLLLIGAVLAFAAGWYSGFLWPNLIGQMGNDDIETLPTPMNKVVAQGRLVPAGGIINVLIPSGQRIETLLVEEGVRVKSGETELATLSSTSVLTTQTKLAEAQSDSAETELEQRLLLAENNLLAAQQAEQAAQMQLEQAERLGANQVPEKQLRLSEQKLNRLHQLLTDPQTSLFVSQSQLAEQQLSLEQAQAELNIGRRQQQDAVALAQSSLKTASQARQAAERTVESWKRLQTQNQVPALSRQLAHEQLNLARIVAPADGTVLKIFAKPGESVVNVPLLQIGDLSSMECAVEVIDRLVPHVQVGKRAVIQHVALSRPIHGTVVQIGRMVGNGTLLDPSPLAMVDRKTVDVRIAIDSEDAEIANRLINLQVTVEIETQDTGVASLETSAE